MTYESTGRRVYERDGLFECLEIVCYGTRIKHKMNSIILRTPRFSNRPDGNYFHPTEQNALVVANGEAKEDSDSETEPSSHSLE